MAAKLATEFVTKLATKLVKRKVDKARGRNVLCYRLDGSLPERDRDRQGDALKDLVDQSVRRVGADRIFARILFASSTFEPYDEARLAGAGERSEYQYIVLKL